MRSKSSKEPLANFEAMDSVEANASSTPEDKSSDRSNDTAEGESGPMAATILTAINGMKTDFSTRFDGILSTIESVRKDITDCAERVTEAETRISTTQDNVASLQRKVRVLENKNKDMEGKLLDLEMRSRRSNLRLVNLPEGAEGDNACAFFFGELATGRTGTAAGAHKTNGGEGS